MEHYRPAAKEGWLPQCLIRLAVRKLQLIDIVKNLAMAKMRMSAIPMPLSVSERGKLIKSIQFSLTHSPLIGDSSVVVCILDKKLPFLLCRYLIGDCR